MRRLLVWMFFAPLAFASAGCQDNDSALFVRAVLALQPPDCTVQADPTSLMRLGGVLDVGITNAGYMAPLLVGNQLVERGSRDQLRTETSRVSLEGAEVTVLDESGNQIGDSYSVAGTGFVDPGTSDEPGYGILSAMILPPGQSIGRRITQVRVFGTTLGGDEIESAQLTYPITVCSGCLISVPAGGCSLPADLPDRPCYLGQDDYVDCGFLSTQ